MRKTDFIGLRVDPTITKKLDELASHYSVGKSTIIRDLLATCDLVY